MEYRLKQRAPTRLQGRDGSGLALVAKQTTPSSTVRKQSPKPRRDKTLYRIKKSDDSSNDTSKTPPPLPPAPEPPRAPVEDASVLLQRLQMWEKRLKTCSEDQNAVESARTALRRTCVEFIRTYPKTAKKLNVNERLWRSWYREIENQSPSVLKACSMFYGNVVDQLQSSLRRPNMLPEHQDGLKHSLQQSLVALGDVARYKQNRLDKVERDWTEARKYYQQALEVAPSNGKVYNQLGLLAVVEGKLLDGAYMYSRSLVCENPFSTSDNLLHVLQRGRSAAKQLQTQQDTSGEPTCEAMQTYSARALSCLHMISTGKNSKTDWNRALERMKAALVHLLDVCDQQDEAMPIDGPLLVGLSRTLIHAVCLSIVLAQSIQRTVEGTIHLQTLDDGFQNGTRSESTKKALAVGNMTASSMLLKLTTVLSTSAESTRTKYFANSLFPALNIYLDWLHLHQGVTEAIQEKCVALFRILSANGFVERGLHCAQKREGNLSYTTLPEDQEMSGFLPYKKMLHEVTREGNLSRQLTEEERLVLRVTRFMSSSEKYLFAGKSPIPTGNRRDLRGSNSNKSTAASLTSKEAARADPLAVDAVVTGRLCILCSNSSTFPDGECEFCGYEDHDATVTDIKKVAVCQPSWIREYDLAYNSNESSPGKRLPSVTSSPPCRSHPCSSDSSISASSPQSVSPLSPPQKLKTDFKTIMSIGADHDNLVADEDQQRLIVIDAPNVAMRHGKGKVFSSVGIELAVNYFQALGHRVVAFIPDYMLQSDEERAKREEQGDVLTAAKIPDDVALLERLMLKGVLIPTPPQDYDDSYSIHYAGLHNGYVVTNDLFRDHIINMVGPRERKVAMRAWLRAHQISYSWVRNEFLPNPNFRFPDAASDAF